jgi:NitT/TauT family transport system substrate-binding protein
MTTLLSLTLLACSGGEAPAPDATPDAPDAPSLIEVRLALNWFPEPEFGGFYEGVLGGHYEAAGFDVELIPGGPGAPTLELLASGRAEAAISAADDLLVKRSRGVKAIGVWPAFQLAPNGLMAHADGPASFAEIKRGQIAIEVGSPFQTYLWEELGWGEAVQAVPYGGSVGPFLVDGSMIQQAFITAEPCVARAKGAEVNFLKASDAGWNPYGVLLALPDPLPEWAPAFVAATDKAWRAYIESPDRANQKIAQLNDQMTPELLGCVTEAQAPFLTGEDGLGVMTAERWDAMAATLADLELLPAGSTAADAWESLK